MIRLLLAAAFAAALSSAAQAQSLSACKVQTGTPTWTNDQNVPLACNADGTLKTSGGGGGSTGVDGQTSTYTITSTGTQTGVQTAGYGSVLVELLGTFTATVNLQASTDSTDGVSGTWTSVYGNLTEDFGFSAPGIALSSTQRRRLYRAPDGAWVRINTTAYTSGTITAALVRRVAPTGERGVFVGNAVSLASGTVISTTLRAAGTNRSATVNTTAANLMASNAARQGWKVKNDGTNAIWINFDTTASATPGGGNIKIPAGGYLASEPGFIETGAMSAIAETGAVAITAREH